MILAQVSNNLGYTLTGSFNEAERMEKETGSFSLV
jgi:hypothetical protein